jgi:hypothetical protein
MVRWSIAIVVCAGLYACSGGTTANCPDEEPDGCPATVPSYANDVAPIIAQYCARSGCHVAGGSSSNIELSSHSQLAQNSIDAEGEVASCKMPYAPPDLTTAERVTLLTWFVCGSPNN